MAGTEVSVMKELKGILATDNVKNRFNEVLGKESTAVHDIYHQCG